MQKDKGNADCMFQTDFETLQSPSNASKYSNHNKSQSKPIEISPKCYDIQFNFSESGSQYISKTPRVIYKRYHIGHHLHNLHKNKPLEKTYHNPILTKKPKKLDSSNFFKLPEIKSSVEKPRGSYLKYSRCPILPQNKYKYLSILNSFHLSS